MRIDTAMKRINDFLSENIDKIDEFEEERLSFTGKEGEGVPGVLTYQMLCSASRLIRLGYKVNLFIHEIKSITEIKEIFRYVV